MSQQATELAEFPVNFPVIGNLARGDRFVLDCILSQPIPISRLAITGPSAASDLAHRYSRSCANTVLVCGGDPTPFADGRPGTFVGV